MNIDWMHFTPWASLAGGLILGLASAMFILLNGRILGISGILGGLMPPKLGDTWWRIVEWVTAPRIDADVLSVIGAGLLVGIGTRYASGCTSGHGVCGLSRLSPRSLVATLSFMGAGFLIVYVLRHAFQG
jgi:uncharacterized membrane protein YedE/YeeE